MVGIYLIVTLFAQLAHAGSFSLDTLGEPAEVAVDVNQLNGVKVGTPVFVAGNLVGNVSRVAPGAEKEGPSSYTLGLKISPKFRSQLRVGTIALIGSTLATSRVEPEVVVELFIPPHVSEQLPGGSRIVGYTSYEQFWSHGFNA
jgi:hypothetical protein